jgi:hypothetical protein
MAGLYEDAPLEARVFRGSEEITFLDLKPDMLIQVMERGDISRIGVLNKVDVPQHLLIGHFDAHGRIESMNIPISEIREIHVLCPIDVLSLISKLNSKLLKAKAGAELSICD